MANANAKIEEWEGDLDYNLNMFFYLVLYIPACSCYEFSDQSTVYDCCSCQVNFLSMNPITIGAIIIDK